MKRTEFLRQIAELFYYKTIHDPVGNEYVVFANSHLTAIQEIEDKTAFEARENHVHLLDGITKMEFKTLLSVAQKLGPAVLNSLHVCFPEKKFRVYISVKLGDAMILRFHQQWDNEPPYYNPADFSGGSERVLEFSSASVDGTERNEEGTR